MDLNSKIYFIANIQKIVKDISSLGYMVFGVDRDACQNSELSMEDFGFPKQLDQEKMLMNSGVNVKINPKRMLRKFGTFDKGSTSKTEKLPMTLKSKPSLNTHHQQLYINE